MKNKINIFGLSYFIIHFITEIISFYIISTYTKNEIFYLIALIFDFIAFVPQGIVGYLIDELDIKHITSLGIILMTISLLLLYLNVIPIITIIVLAIGNSLTHIDGAEKTLKSSPGKMSPAAFFVSGGSFGVITGKILQSINTPIYIIVIISLIAFVPLFISYKEIDKINKDNLNNYNYSIEKYSIITIILLATFVVSIRSYMGYSIPTTWNKTVIQSVLLFSFMGIGKALGGILIDKIGIYKTTILSTICALPFLIFGDKNMYLSLIGIMFFSMTMAITLGIIVSRLKKNPGVAFGFTTIGLFLGTFPVFFFRIKTFTLNCIVVSTLTIISLIILTNICKKEE